MWLNEMKLDYMKYDEVRANKLKWVETSWAFLKLAIILKLKLPCACFLCIETLAQRFPAVSIKLYLMLS